MEQTDDELIEAYRAGDGQAFRTLVDRYTPQLYGFSYRMTHRAEESEDIVQETFVKVWKTLERYRSEGTFRPWIFAVARNTIIDHLRKKKMPVVSDYDTAEGKNVLMETVADPEALPLELLEKAERKGLLQKGLDALSPDDREVLLLHYGEEMTFDAIGTMLKKPLNTVKSRHRRAILKLKEYFKDTEL